MSTNDLPLDEAALDRLHDNHAHDLVGDWPSVIAQARAALTYRTRVAELEAHANALRDALEFTQKCTGCAMCSANATVALASTPAASLAAHDAEVRYAAFSEVLNLMDATSIGSAEAEWDNLDARIRALAAQEVK